MQYFHFLESIFYFPILNTNNHYKYAIKRVIYIIKMQKTTNNWLQKFTKKLLANDRPKQFTNNNN